MALMVPWKYFGRMAGYTLKFHKNPILVLGLTLQPDL